MASHPARIPALDGLRAISIILVVLAHLRPSAGAPRLDWMPLPGTAGVCLFFIISGYLITTLLCEEREQSGAIAIGRFYGRRALRLLPACYLFLATMVVLRRFGAAKFTNLSLLSAATYWRNYLWTGDWSLDHCWSLSIEEQF